MKPTLRNAWLWVQLRKMRKFAIADAIVGVDLAEERAVAIAGPRPAAYDPRSNTEHRRLQLARTNSTHADELRDDARNARAAAAHEFSPTMSGAFAALLLIAEATGAAQILHAQGMAPPVAVFLGGMFALGFFALAFFCAQNRDRRLTYWIAVAVLMLLVAAVVTLRVNEFGSVENSSASNDYAFGIVFAALTVGPALLAERVFRSLYFGLRARAELRLKGGLLRVEERSIQAAERQITKLRDDPDEWDHAATRLRAVYRSTWRYERARMLATAGRGYASNTDALTGSRTELLRKPQLTTNRSTALHNDVYGGTRK